MRKLYVVKNARDFERIIKEGHYVKNKSFIIYYSKNDLQYSRYGISVGKKLGNAVFRNKYKRKIRAIIDNYKKKLYKYSRLYYNIKRKCQRQKLSGIRKRLHCTYK